MASASTGDDEGGVATGVDGFECMAPVRLGFLVAALWAPLADSGSDFVSFEVMLNFTATCVTVQPIFLYLLYKNMFNAGFE